MNGVLFVECDDDEPGPQLGDSKVSCLKNAAVGQVAHILKLAKETFSIISKLCTAESGHVFNHYCTGTTFSDNAKGSRKHVPLIIVSELLTGNAERRAWNTRCQKIHSFVGPAVELPDVCTNHTP